MTARAPRSLRDPVQRAQRVQAAGMSPNVRALNKWVRQLESPAGRKGDVPLFDPASGGVDARILLLLESPGQRAVAETHGLAKVGSGLISADNDDRTAENVWRALRSARVPYSMIAIWNAVPWYVGTQTRLRKPSATDRHQARPLLSDLLHRLPLVCVVVPLGRVAQSQWTAFQLSNPTHLVTVPSWHPSPLSLNHPGRRADLVTALRRARMIAAKT